MLRLRAVVSGTYHSSTDASHVSASQPGQLQGGEEPASLQHSAGNQQPPALSVISHLFSVAVVLVLLGTIASTMRVWQANGPLLLPSGSYALIPALLLSFIACHRWMRLSKRPTLRSLRITPQGVAVGLFVVFVSDWFDRSYNFFPSPFVRGEILLFGACFLLVPSRWKERSLRLLLPLSALALAATFFTESNGRLLYSDDHPSFFFRLSMLKERFPWIPFYYPYWNGGLDARDFFATGSLSGFLIFAPLIYFFDLSTTYNLLIALILFALLPGSVYVSAALEGWDKTSRAIAATLALCCGLVWYRWALKYGTMGFIISASLVPLNLSLAGQLLQVTPKVSLKKTLSFVTTTTLMLLWSASALVFIPLAVLVVCSFLYRLLKGIRPILQSRACLAGLLLLAVNLPWMTVFWSVSNVSRFLSRDAANVTLQVEDLVTGEASSRSAPLPQDGAHRGFRHKEGALDLGKSLGVVREKSFSTNPLILLFALPGIFFLAPRSRVVLLGTGAWLLFLGSVMVPLKPQLELDRMLLVLTIIAALPAGRALRELLLSRGTLPLVFEGSLKGLAAGILFASPFCTAAILSNRTVEQYHFADELVQHLAKAIRELGGEGRTVFSGCILHELEEGHIAPLTIWTGKELVASAPFHTLWKYTQVIPKSFIERGDIGIEEYLTLMNSTSVVAHEREWRDYFSARPEKYTLVWREDRFSLFTRKDAVNAPFLEGKGSLIGKSTHSLRVRIDGESATLKYNYFPFLKSSGCTLSSADVAPEIRFIRLTGCTPGAEITIESEPPWKRVLG